MKKAVFISHSHKDKELALALKSELEKKGIGAWVCSVDIPEGENWSKEIVDAIEACELFLFLLTEHSCSSGQCNKEIGLADMATCKSVCLEIDKVELEGEAKYHLSNSQKMFAERESFFDNVETVAARVRACMRSRGADGSHDSDGLPARCFTFRLDGKNECEPLTKSQQLDILELVSKGEGEIFVSVSDTNVELLEERCRQLEEGDALLSDQELVELERMKRYCDRQKRDNRVKGVATALFLADKETRQMCGVNSVSGVWEVVKDILEYEIRCPIAPPCGVYAPLEFFLPKSAVSFTVYVKHELLSRYRENDGYLFEVGPRPVHEFDRDLWRESLTCFYIHLARRKLAGELPDNDERSRDLLRYMCGLK